MFKRILIANRGEIAVRIIRTCRKLGIKTVAVYSEADRRALHVLEADEGVHIGRSAAADSYLNVETIIAAAVRTGAEAVHPGYGLLSENPALADACTEAGLVFVGPPAQVMRVMGDKSAARRLVASRGVLTIPGYDDDGQLPADLLKHANEMGFPIMVKAAMGGGGRGMRLVDSADRFEDALDSARREAERAFGDGRLLLERVVSGRHVEIQVLADQHDNIIHLGERDCSVQRRHQKIIEESPSPAVDDALRRKLGEAALQVAGAVGYTNAGTVEFLLAEDGVFYFLEMNTRLQVEHGVTELVTGLDLVALQLAIASGEALPFSQEDVALTGHAVECRVYAEDPQKGYLPSPGRITHLELPSGDGIRNDSGVYEGDEVTTYYDPMIAKVLAWGDGRKQALDRMAHALSLYRVGGVHTNLALLSAVIASPDFRDGNVTTDFLDTRWDPRDLAVSPPLDALIGGFAAVVFGVGAGGDPWLQAGAWRAGVSHVDLRYSGAAHSLTGRRVPGSRNEWIVNLDDREHAIRVSVSSREQLVIEIDGRTITVSSRRLGAGLRVTTPEGTYHFDFLAGAQRAVRADAGVQRNLAAPMPGLVLKVLVRPGDTVRTHQVLVVIEAMKMEHAIEAPYDGIVKKVHCAEGGRVAEGSVLVELTMESA